MSKTFEGNCFSPMLYEMWKHKIVTDTAYWTIRDHHQAEVQSRIVEELSTIQEAATDDWGQTSPDMIAELLSDRINQLRGDESVRGVPPIEG